MSRFAFFALTFFTCTGATFALFGTVLPEFFILDDFVWLQCAHDTVNHDLGHIFTRHINFFFRPVVHALFGALYGLAGPKAPLFHAAALILHGLTAALLGLLALELMGASRWKGLVAALTFVLLHAAYGEAMVWISALAEPLVTSFGLLALLAWLRVLDQRQPWRGPWLYLAYLAALFAMGCKESAVVIWPLLVVMQLVLTRGSGRFKQPSWWAHLPFLVLLVTYLLMQVVVQQQNPLVRSGLYSLRVEAVVLLFNCVMRLATIGAWPLGAALLALLGARAMGWQITPIPARPLLATILGLLAALVAALLPYVWFKGDMVATRYFYTATTIVSLAVAALLIPLKEPRLQRQGAVLALVLAAAVVNSLGAARMELRRYRQAATPVERFVQAVTRLTLGGEEALVINSPLRGLQLRGAFYVFHPTHPNNVWGTHKNKLPRSWKKKPAFRWDPVSGHFRQIQ
jgi:hypothetical protein